MRALLRMGSSWVRRFSRRSKIICCRMDIFDGFRVKLLYFIKKQSNFMIQDCLDFVVKILPKDEIVSVEH